MIPIGRGELTWRCPLPADPARIRVGVAGADTEGRLLVGELTMPPRWPGPPWHVHHATDLGIYVLGGRVAVKVGPSVRTLRPGACLWLPRDMPHGFGNTEAEPATVLLLASPAEPFGSLLSAIEDALDQSGGRALVTAEFDRRAREHDMTVLGPPFLPARSSPVRRSAGRSSPPGAMR